MGLNFVDLRVAEKGRKQKREGEGGGAPFLACLPNCARAQEPAPSTRPRKAP